MGNSAVGSSWLRSGEEHCHRALSVKVRWETLLSGACVEARSPVESSRLRSGGEHSHWELVVEVRWRKLVLGGGLPVNVWWGSLQGACR